MTHDEALAPTPTQRAARAILSGIDRAVDAEWASAQVRAATVPGRTVRDQVRHLATSFARELGTVGAVTGTLAAVPALGTASAVSAGAAELGYFTIRAAELILTIGALHGHTESTPDERRAWILSILVFGNAAAEGFTRLAVQSGRRLGLLNGVRLPVAVLRGVNSSMGRTIITRYGRKRATVGLGTALPFGIGAVVARRRPRRSAGVIGHLRLDRTSASASRWTEGAGEHGAIDTIARRGRARQPPPGGADQGHPVVRRGGGAAHRTCRRARVRGQRRRHRPRR